MARISTMEKPEPDVSETALPSVESTSAKRIRLLKQTMMVLTIALTFLIFGLGGGWTNPALSDISHDNTTVYGTTIALEAWEADMTGSLIAVGMIPGAFLGGWMGTKTGRRCSLMLLQMPAILGWILIALAYNPTLILVGRFLHGMNCGGTGVIGNSYIVEISDTGYRGMFACMPGTLMSIGNVAPLGLGFILRWFQIPYFAIAVVILVVVLVSFLPESPTYLALSGKEQEARRILTKLRGPAIDIEIEMEVIREMNENKVEESLIPTLLRSGLWKNLVVVSLLLFFQSFCGYIVIKSFTTRIFIEAGSSVDDKVAALLVLLILLVGYICSMICIDKFGRKNLIVLSTGFVGLFSFLAGTYYYLENNKGFHEEPVFHLDSNNTTVANTIAHRQIDVSWSWVPVVCVMGMTFSGALGIAPVPWILSAEYFPTSIRTKCMGITSTLASIWSFASLQLFSPLLFALTTAGLFWFYGGISVLAVVFCLTCVVETKNKDIG